MLSRLSSIGERKFFGFLTRRLSYADGHAERFRDAEERCHCGPMHVSSLHCSPVRPCVRRDLPPETATPFRLRAGLVEL